MGKSVLCILQTGESLRDSSLYVAQVEALALKLPLAAVTIIEEKEAAHKIKYLNVFKSVEEELLKFNIPLICLIGNKQEVLKALYLHLQPQAVFDTQTTPILKGRLKLHPYAWSGQVISVKQLIYLVVSKLL